MLFSELKINIDNKTFNISDLNIKTYIPIFEKKIMIDKICEDIISYENGIAYVDNIQKKVSISLSVLLNYCDLDIDVEKSDILDMLDLLFEKGIYKDIEEQIGEDLNEFYLGIEAEIENIKIRNNSMEAIFAKGVNDLTTIVYGLIDRIPDEKTVQKFIKSNVKLLPKIINEVKPENLEVIKSIIGNVKLGLGKEKK
jgi:hypothetical protein